MIEINNLSKSFGSKKVLKGISLNVEKGDKIVLLGPSGSGKSTLLRCINLLNDYDGGEILYNGQDVTKLDVNLYRQKVGMVFQHFNLFKHMTVLQNIMFAPIFYGKKQIKEKKKLLKQNPELINDEYVKSLPDNLAQVKENAKIRAMELLEKVGLSEKANEYPSTLSGGQQQRIAIVRAVANNPEVLLFDEPTSALDIAMIQEVLEVIEQLANDGMTMVIVTHELKFAKNIASKIVFLNEGNILEVGTPDEIFNHPKHPRLLEFLEKTK